MFETRSQAWREVGLVQEVSRGAVKRARLEALLLVPLFVAVVLLYDNRASLGLKHSSSEVKGLVQAATAVLLLILGWAIARDAGRALGPALFRRLDPATAGIVGFLIRLVTIAIALLVALVVAGVETRTLAVGGAFTAVILGLAAQQTLGNLIAGTLLLSAGPFRVGDRVRLQGGPLAGQIEGIASSLGLLYTTFATDEGSILVPNSVVLNVAVHTGAGALRTYKGAADPAGGASGDPEGDSVGAGGISPGAVRSADATARSAAATARPAPPPPPAGSTRGSPARRAR
jgi:small-conductance mechanosensitive channel